MRRHAADFEPTEDAEQKSLAAWLNFRKVLWTHCPNGGLRNIRTARNLKSMGVKPGVPDILIFSRPKAASFVGVAIELKRQSVKKASSKQTEWLLALASQGWQVNVCSGADSAISWLTGLGY